MKDLNIYSETFSSGRKHYFLDIRKTPAGASYLRICRSDELDNGKYTRASVVIFEEDFQQLIQGLTSVFHHASYLST